MREARKASCLVSIEEIIRDSNSITGVTNLMIKKIIAILHHLLITHTSFIVIILLLP